ncbi:MAG: hypothetical protein ACK5MK_06885 [Dysgonomonas sp.]
MKRILLLIICSFFFFVQMNAQGAMVVTDPGNLAQIMELVKSGAEQTKSLNEQVNYLKEAKENLEVVSNYLKTAQTVDRAIKQSKKTIDVLNKLTSGLSSFGNLNSVYISTLTGTLSGYYTDVNTNISEITNLLTDGKLKLSDSERLQLINERLDEVHLIEVKAKKAYSKAYSINNRLNVLK